MRKKISQLLMRLIGRRSLWRLGRFLYMEARRDVPNQMETNGEQAVQFHLLHVIADRHQKFTIFDVGANIGAWTLRLLQQSIDLKINDYLNIYLFEPVPSTFQYLERKIFPHRDTSFIKAEPLALSDSSGFAQMFIYAEKSGINSLHQIPMKEIQCSIQVAKTTVDKYCEKENIDTIHFLKCDTEGHDMSVIKGAKRMFEHERIKVCQFEYNHRWIFSRHYLKDVFDYFNDSVYHIGKITPDEIQLFEKWHLELERFFEGNYLLIHKDALGWFSVRKGKFDSYNTLCFKFLDKTSPKKKRV